MKITPFAALFGAISLLVSACSLNEQTRQRLSSDWELCDSLRGSSASPLHAKIFGEGPVSGSRYHAYFTERAGAVQGEGILYASCHGAFACSQADGPVRVSNAYGQLDLPPVLRLSFLIHEARHAEGVRHERCPEGVSLVSPYQKVDLRGAQECDANEWGAYGVQYVWLTNIAHHCTSCSATERKQALDYSGFILRLVNSPDARARLISDALK
jgi:hypothetical protein